ncbi:MAG: response regulator [Terracidiphilus sp.]
MSLKRILLVEDEPRDIRLAASTAESIGISEVDARSSIQAARNYLDNGLRGEGPLPDGIVLDLNLGYESGYELLRYWHSEPRLSKIPVIVWSVLGDEQRHMCSLFHVSRYVAKWDGPKAIQEALESLNDSVSSQT